MLHAAWVSWRVTYFYIINRICGLRMPRRQGSWLSIVPWVRGGEEGRDFVPLANSNIIWKRTHTKTRLPQVLTAAIIRMRSVSVVALWG